MMTKETLLHSTQTVQPKSAHMIGQYYSDYNKQKQKPWIIIILLLIMLFDDIELKIFTYNYNLHEMTH